MDREEKARMYHEQGFNCAQAVLAACGDVTGLDEKQLVDCVAITKDNVANLKAFVYTGK